MISKQKNQTHICIYMYTHICTYIYTYKRDRERIESMRFEGASGTVRIKVQEKSRLVLRIPRSWTYLLDLIEGTASTHTQSPWEDPKDPPILDSNTPMV